MEININLEIEPYLDDNGSIGLSVITDEGDVTSGLIDIDEILQTYIDENYIGNELDKEQVQKAFCLMTDRIRNAFTKIIIGQDLGLAYKDNRLVVL